MPSVASITPVPAPPLPSGLKGAPPRLRLNFGELLRETSFATHLSHAGVLPVIEANGIAAKPSASPLARTPVADTKEQAPAKQDFSDPAAAILGASSASSTARPAISGKPLPLTSPPQNLSSVPFAECPQFALSTAQRVAEPRSGFGDDPTRPHLASDRHKPASAALPPQSAAAAVSPDVVLAPNLPPSAPDLATPAAPAPPFIALSQSHGVLPQQPAMSAKPRPSLSTVPTFSSALLSSTNAATTSPQALPLKGVAESVSPLSGKAEGPQPNSKNSSGAFQISPQTPSQTTSLAQPLAKLSPLLHSGSARPESASGNATIESAALLSSPAAVHSIGAAPMTNPHLQPPSANAPLTPVAAHLPASDVVPNLYDKIDQGASPVVLRSAAQQVSVGLRDPNLGWVEIKTQNLAGRVDATLVTASGQAHASLSAQLPAISDYLQQREVPIANLAVHHHHPGATLGDAGRRGAENGGAGSRQPGHSSSDNSGNPHSDVRLQPLRLPASLRDDESLSFRPLSYISVRA